MNFSYTTERDQDGLEVKTVEGLGITGRNFALELATSKHGNTIKSIAYVYEVPEPGVKRMDLCGDYRKTLATSPARATGKALIACHEKALELFAQAIDDAQEHTHTKLAREAKQDAEAKERADNWTASLAGVSAAVKARNDAAMQDANCTSHPMHY